MRCLLLIFPWWQLVFTGAQDIPTTTCKDYVVEGETLACYCTGSCSNGKKPTLTWPDHSNTSRLEKHNISRQQHGQNFTCRKVCGNETTEVNYTLQVAYGPDAASSNITGPSPFITNGTLSMTLTCEATVNPTPFYTWSDVICDNGNDDRTCTYTPPITEDGKLVKCDLINPENNQARPVTVEFDINLSYPPPNAPNISEGSGSILTAKDILTCSVTGGKPLVDSVNFTCTNPYHRTQDGETANTSVSSSLTIDTSQATTDNMTCYCSANWAPRPEFYTMKSERNFSTECPAKVKTFELNGTKETVTVTESDQYNVTLKCEGGGRPGPGLLLSRTSHDGTVNLTERNRASEDTTVTSLDYNITMANWTDMGNYTCVVYNGVGLKDISTVTLYVNSEPRPASHGSEGRDRKTPLNMSDNVIQIDLMVFPEPQQFTYTHYSSDSDLTGDDVSQENMFTSHVTNSGPGSNFVTCIITGINVPERYIGVYKVRISNDFGSVDYFFAVKEQIVGPDVVSASTDTIIIIVVPGSVGSLSAVVIIVVVVRRRRKGRNASNDDHQTSQSPCNSKGYYTNPTFAKNGTDADTDIGVVMSASCHSPDGAGYAVVGDFPSSTQPDGVRRQKSSGSAAYEVTDIAMGRVSIKEAAPPQPNVYQEPWDAVKAQSMVADFFTVHGVIIATGPEGDKHSI